MFRFTFYNVMTATSKLHVWLAALSLDSTVRRDLVLHRMCLAHQRQPHPVPEEGVGLQERKDVRTCLAVT